MATEPKIVKLGSIYLDHDLNLKVLHPENHSHAADLSTECQKYMKNHEDFMNATDEFVKNKQEQAEKVEKTRLKSVGLRFEGILVGSSRVFRA